jgi:hypothetical protein
VINYGCKDRLFLPTSTKPIGSSDTSVITLNFSPLIRSLYLLFLSPFLPRISQQMACDDFFCHFGEEVNGSVISFRRQVFFIFVSVDLGSRGMVGGRWNMRRHMMDIQFQWHPIEINHRGEGVCGPTDAIGSFKNQGLEIGQIMRKKNVEFVNPAFNPLPSPKGCLIVSPRPSQVHQLSLLLPKSSPLCFLVAESLTRTRCKL